MIGDDLTPFFGAGEFTVAASWAPSGGGSPVADQVILDSADAEILSGRQSATEYKITFPASSALAALDEGEIITVNGASYEVRSTPDKIDDGLLMAVNLEAL